MMKRKRHSSLMACLLAALLPLMAYASEIMDVPPDTQALLAQWEEVMEAPDFVLNGEEYLADEKAITTPLDAVSIAIEMVKDVEQIGAEALTEYTPSVEYFVARSEKFPSIGSPYWYVTLIPPEGQGLRPYHIKFSAEVLEDALYDVLTPEGELERQWGYDLDRILYWEVIDREW